MSYRLRAPREGSPYWQAIITTPDGHTFEKSTRKRLKGEARKVAERWDRASTDSDHHVSLRDAIDALRRMKMDKGSAPATMEILEQKAGHLLGFFGPERIVATIRHRDTVEYVRHRRGHRVSDSTITKELRELTHALRWLRKNELHDGDPSAIWPGDILKPAKPRDRWLTLQEYEALLLAMAPARSYERGGKRVTVEEPMGEDWRDHLTMYVYTGLRLSELYRIRRADITGDYMHVAGTKTSASERDVPLALPALQVVRRRSEMFPRRPLFPVTSRDSRGAKSMDNQERAWIRALSRGCRRAQIPHASTNDLRRTFCSWGFQRGVSEGVMRKWMGHASSKMIAQVYAQTSREQGRDEIAKLPVPTGLPRIHHKDSEK